MSEASVANELVVQRLVAAINDNDETGVRGVIHADLASHGALGDVHGPDGFVGIMLHNVHGAFPDAHIDLAKFIGDGDFASFRLHGSGTHSGPFLGVAPTGRSVRINGIHQVRFADGLIIEHWQGPDILAMLIDMGMFPPAPRS